MISTVINPKGNRRDNQFSRCEASIVSNGSDMLRNIAEEDGGGQEDRSVRLRGLLGRLVIMEREQIGQICSILCYLKKRLGNLLDMALSSPLTKRRKAIRRRKEQLQCGPLDLTAQN